MSTLGIMRTHVWMSTLAPQSQGDPDEAPRGILRSSFLKFRERAAHISGEIARDLPDFTVHDITHMDGLWEMVDLIAGQEVALTPAEAFVLGGSILIHDIGMGLAAYPGGKAQLQEDKSWPDTIASILQRRTGKSASKAGMSSISPEVEREAIAETLRNIHARHADHLALTNWSGRDGTKYYLIDNPELRDSYGSVIGRIAYSHWWSVSDLREKFATVLGAPVGFPKEWSVDPLKIACLLRLADAGHLDARRAPAFLHALRKPHGIAMQHWAFQEKLHQPRVDNQRLVYTSGNPFCLQDASAWWLCFETLQMVDRELRQVDALLADMHRPRMRARAVAGADDPVRLTEFIPTVGWRPVDARVRVSDVPSLVQRLGGEQLYGRDPTVPLRELIQNASDAVRARRLLRDLPTNWGDIIVRLGNDSNGPWLEVEDTGIGMSAAVLTGPLLDFGTSYWNSWLMRQELVGLAAKGFSPTGRYGIGFFSVFMWGARVRVVTRRFDEAEKDTRVLEFATGPATQPILRDSTEEERLQDGGTRVRVWLRVAPNAEGGLLSIPDGPPRSLKRLCAWISPALDVNLSVEDTSGKRTRVVAASDWISISAKKLLERIATPINHKKTWHVKEDISRSAPFLRLLFAESGQLAGRVAIVPDHFFSQIGVVTVGGLRAHNTYTFAGILCGSPTTAARNSAIPDVDTNGLRKWISEQKDLLIAAHETRDELSGITGIVYRCGGNIEDLPVCRGAMGWMTAQEIESWSDIPNEIILVERAGAIDELELSDVDVKLGANVLAIESSPRLYSLVSNDTVGEKWPGSSVIAWSTKEPLDWRWWSLANVVVRALAKAWSVDPGRLFASLAEREDEFYDAVVGTVNDLPFRSAVMIIRKSDAF
ncbi:HD domain-containing protein [Sorangium sp. So ce1153]|uniref:HD domain-containing protein n=1 Tax=Sorangium sp. So ce1153 TaxID=3133333 RepID=UPI003F61064F